MVNNPIFYAPIMTLWLVALPGFLIISSISGVVNVMSIVVLVAACFLVLGCLGVVIIAHWAL
jgi:hypothetical protein